MNDQKTIFIVDDIVTNLSVVKDALKADYRVRTLSSAAHLFELLSKVKPDLILLDIEMPVMTGIEAFDILRADKELSDIPVIFLTSVVDSQVESDLFAKGAVDFVSKPFSEAVLRNRIKMHLNLNLLIKERTRALKRKTKALKRIQDALVSVLSDMVENRDQETGGHVWRTSEYMRLLIEEMVRQGLYREELHEEDIEMLVASAKLHDIGKIKISDNVLNKPGKLSDEEFDRMRHHTTLGADIIDRMMSLSGEAQFLDIAKVIALSHHERWDGTGYPAGLQGREIPLQARIMSLVDVYDALRSERPYKAAMSPDETVTLITEAAGTQFDPEIVQVFLSIKDRFEALREEEEEA